MPNQKQQTSFLFVESTRSWASQSHDVRHAIRKQAMASAATSRRESGKWGKVNLLQYPSTDHDQPGSAKVTPSHQSSGNFDRLSHHRVKHTRQDVGDAGADFEASWAECSMTACITEVTTSQDSHHAMSKIAPNMPYTGYEALRCRLNLDVLDLSGLTTYHISRVTAQQLARQPSQLVHILRCRQWSFLSYLPSRLGSTPCLDAVTECVMTRVSEYVKSDGQPPSKSALSLYGRAVSGVQKALSDRTQAMKPEVLCAVRFLALWELLSESPSEAWDYHMNGLNALVKLRGPEKYTSAFEKSLLLAMLGPMFTEALVKDSFCFIDEEPWQMALRNCVLENSGISDCSEIAILLWSILCHIPRLYHEIQQLVCKSPTYELVPHSVVMSYVRRTSRTLQRLQAWRQDYDTLRLSHDRSLAFEPNAFFPVSEKPPPETDKSCELLGICLGAMVALNRLLVALAPTNPDAASTEATAQAIASQILDLEQRAVRSNPRAALFMGFKVVVARSVLATSEWADIVAIGANRQVEDRLDEDRDEGVQGQSPVRLIDKEVFERWCRAKGRKITSQ